MFFVNGSLVPLAHAARFIVMLNLEKVNLLRNTKNN